MILLRRLIGERLSESGKSVNQPVELQRAGVLLHLCDNRLLNLSCPQDELTADYIMSTPYSAITGAQDGNVESAESVSD